MNPKDIAKTRTQVHRPTRVHKAKGKLKDLCPICEGAGQYRFVCRDAAGLTGERVEDCEACGGTGYVEGE